MTDTELACLYRMSRVLGDHAPDAQFAAFCGGTWITIQNTIPDALFQRLEGIFHSLPEEQVFQQSLSAVFALKNAFTRWQTEQAIENAENPMPALVKRSLDRILQLVEEIDATLPTRAKATH